MRRSAPVVVDDRCEDCGRSVIEQRPGEEVPAFCDSCHADFMRGLRTGHVYYGDEVVYPSEP